MQPFKSGISLVGTVQSQQLADVVRSTANPNVKIVLALWCNEVNLKIWLSEYHFTITFRGEYGSAMSKHPYMKASEPEWSNQENSYKKYARKISYPDNVPRNVRYNPR